MKNATIETKSPAIQQAATLGSAAFAAGKKCVPWHDLALHTLLKENGGFGNTAIVSAWSKAWHKANLAAPVTGWSEAADDLEVISSYSRAQSIEDGNIVDVSTVAREAGIKFPIAVSRAVWASYVEIPEGVECQDEDGRLWDILYMFAQAARRYSGAHLNFSLYVRNSKRAKLDRRDMVTLQAVVGPGDDMAPVITIMELSES